MVASVEVDRRILGERWVAISGETEEAAERGNRPGTKTGQCENLVRCSEPEAAGRSGGAKFLAVQLSIGWQHEQGELAVEVENKGLGTTGERRAARGRGCFAREDRLMMLDGELCVRGAELRRQSLKDRCIDLPIERG